MIEGFEAKVITEEAGVTSSRDMSPDEVVHMLLEMAEGAESTEQADTFLTIAARVRNGQTFTPPTVLH